MSSPEQRQDGQVRVHHYERKQGITRTPEFEKKGLATHACNVGFKCGFSCTYCSTGTVYWQQSVFKKVGERPLKRGYAIVDPGIPERVARDARTMPDRGLVQLSTTTDAWSPEARAHNLGRRCLEAILQEPDWSVRVLTKGAEVVQDFDVLERHRDRVRVGLSITGTPNRSGALSALEPYASPIEDRIAAMEEAHRRGLRTFLMACPLFPGISDSRAEVDWLVQFAERIGAQEIFCEPVNGRGEALPSSVEALRNAGYPEFAAQMDAIRREVRWSNYTKELISTVQASVKEYSDISKLRILLYPSELTASDLEQIKASDEGVIWLGKGTGEESETAD